MFFIPAMVCCKQAPIDMLLDIPSLAQACGSCLQLPTSVVLRVCLQGYCKCKDDVT